MRKLGGAILILALGGLAALAQSGDDDFERFRRQEEQAFAAAVEAGAIDDLTRQGANLILIACSEFSLLTPDLTGPVPLLDTVDVLAEAIGKWGTE